ncbi:hypothetical protein [Streptomyces sp. NPDC048636]|uniref:RICIN domain-containing protein n=1 Tax=Streptomyces sp. NPDC048636 TaxID=3155762 RepID=UPI00343AD6A4
MFVLDWDVDDGSLMPSNELMPLVQEQVPAALRPCFLLGNPLRPWIHWPGERTGEGDLTHFTFALWREGSDDADGQRLVLNDALREEQCIEDDESSVIKLLSDLISPSPDQIVLGEMHTQHDSGDEGPWLGAGVPQAGAIRHIMALRPLTEEVVQALNPTLHLEDATVLSEAIGYPQDGSRARTCLPGAGAPLVADIPLGGWGTPWAGHALEAGADGGHRILVRHTGMAWEAVGSGPDARIVRAEPHDGPSQRFIIQLVRGDGTYEPTDSWIRYSSYRIQTADGQLALQAPADRGPLLLASPHDVADQRFEAEYTFHGDAEPPFRSYQALMSPAGCVGIRPEAERPLY